MRNGKCPKCNSAEVYHSFSDRSLDAGLRTGDGQPLLNIHTDKGGLFGDDFALTGLAFASGNQSHKNPCGECFAPTSRHQLIGNRLYAHDLNILKKLPGSKNWKKV